MTSAPSTPKATQAARFAEIDGLRGIAVITVILVHYYSRLVQKIAPGFYDFYSNLAGISVDLFFVISGFLIGGILLDHQPCGATTKTFYLRRALRILPIYWLALYVAFEPFSGVNEGGDSQVSFLSYFFFQQNLSTALGFVPPKMLFPLWSLAIEEHFYAMAPLMFRWMSVRKILMTLLTIILLSPALRELTLSWNPPHAYEIVHKFPLVRLDAIAFGVLGALLWRNVRARHFLDEYKKLLPWLVLLLGGLTLAYYVPIPGLNLGPVFWLRLTTQAAFFLALTFLCLLRSEGWVAGFCRLGFLRWAGVRCYFLYVFHYPIRVTVFPFIKNPHTNTLVALLLCLIFAEISWRLVEKPLINYAKRWNYGPRKGPEVEDLPSGLSEGKGEVSLIT